MVVPEMKERTAMAVRWSITVLLVLLLAGCKGKSGEPEARTVDRVVTLAKPLEAKVVEPVAIPEGVDGDLHGGAETGLSDEGVFGELDGEVRLGLTSAAVAGRTSLSVDKKSRTLSVLVDGVAVKTCPVALGFTPEGHKVKQGDGRTPEGDYTICEMLHEDLAPRYGARSMRISYPNAEDAARGLEAGLVTQAQHDAIVEAIEAGQMPPQNTKLGSSIRIHGGGVEKDWTAGCIALRDEDVIEIYDVVQPGTSVTVRAGPHPDLPDADSDGIPDQVDILLGALKAALNGASYDGGYQKIAYPMGDVDPAKGCCTDVIIRSFRNAGIDLQERIHEDIVAHAKAYPHVDEPNTDIDHRRVRNMVIYMDEHMKSLCTDPSDDACTFLPGDVVLFDTLPRKGPDHVGIVSFKTDDDGLPLVVNNWTTGTTTAHMDLLSWCPVTHHFRWTSG